MKLNKKQIEKFQKSIYDYYTIFGRPFPWRETTEPYHIFVSEVMLQQTQTSRVVAKYLAFIQKFPDFKTLANASQYDLLQVWQGLGYNRRALALQKSARLIIEKYEGVLPESPEELITLPGIGPATAASIAAFAFNSPTVFVETNIRVVFFHFFFQEKESVHDNEILDLVAQTVTRGLSVVTQNPRTWYYALMDYGVMLKAQGINPLKKSKHYTKQSAFQGSDRQIRGAILKVLLSNREQTVEQVTTTLQKKLPQKSSDKKKATNFPQRVERIVAQLLDESFVAYEDNYLIIKGKR